MAGTKAATGVGLHQLDISPRLVAPGAASWLRVPAATDAAYKQGVAEVEQWGDDVLQNNFYHSQKGTISCKSTYQATAVLEMLSGNTVRTSGGAELVDIGTVAELTPQQVSLRALVSNARDAQGNPTNIRLYFYCCTVKTVFEDISMSTGKLSECTLNFTTYSSQFDENGATLPVACFGRIEIGRPAFGPGVYGTALYGAVAYS